MSPGIPPGWVACFMEEVGLTHLARYSILKRWVYPTNDVSCESCPRLIPIGRGRNMPAVTPRFTDKKPAWSFRRVRQLGGPCGRSQ